MLMEFILSISLILPGFWILRLTKVKAHNNAEQLAFSYILSLVMMFSLLYLGSIMNAFHAASLIVLAIVAISSIHLLVLFAVKVHHSLHLFQTVLFSRISTEKLAVVVSIIGLLSIYVLFLFSRAILDSDVAHTYLPIAREIVRGNGFTYSNGYDYNILLKPIGVSVLYAWTYVVSGSTLSESFRLLPLVPILTLIALNYAITTSATKSKTIGIISTTLFLVFPFHDRFLLYTAAYPDLFYYPLIFAATFFLLEYSQSKLNRYMFWSGLALGAASLLKAQTIYFLIAFVLVFVVFELRNFKKFSIALCALTPFYILFPNILADSIQRDSFRLSIPSFTEMQLGLFLIISMLSSLCCYVTIRWNVTRVKIEKYMIISSVKKIALLLLPFMMLSSLWYVNNLLRFGTLIWTSSANLPNYDWALGVLKSTEIARPTTDTWHYIAYFMFSFIDPAVMGYIMFIPFLIGLVFVLRRRSESLNILLLLGSILVSIILSVVVISIHSATSGYNPRDILPLAPLLTTLSAIGIVSATSNICKKTNTAKNTLVSLLLVAYFGLLSYVHSVYVWFTNSHQITKIGEFMSALGQSVGLNLAQTSFQLSYRDRAIFVGENISKVVSLSVIAGVPVLALMIYPYRKLFTRDNKIVASVAARLKEVVLKLSSYLYSSKKWVLVKNVFVTFLMLSVIVIPRVEMLIVQGGLQEIRENQLKRNYGEIYKLFENPGELDGGILTFKAHMGLPYYMPGVKIIDLSYPANLADLKDILTILNSEIMVATLRQRGIQYLLLTPERLNDLDQMLNSSIGRIAMNPALAKQVGIYGSWTLYALGPFEVLGQETLLLGEESWSIYRAPEQANFSFDVSSERVYLQVTPVNDDSRLDVVEGGLPEYDVSDFDYLTIDVSGSDNALFSVRLYFSDGTSYDFPYWGEVPKSGLLAFGLENFREKVFRGDLYVSLKAKNDQPAHIEIKAIRLINLQG